MATIACDICGGKLSMDASGEFATCDSCGMQHTKERVRTMAQEVTGTVAVSNIAGIESLMKRGKLALEDTKWKDADGFFDQVLNIDAEYAPAYIGKLCSTMKLRGEGMLGEDVLPYDQDSNFKKALRFADEIYKAKLDDYYQNSVEKIKETKERLAPLIKKAALNSVCLCRGVGFLVGLNKDGTVAIVGQPREGYSLLHVSDWRNVIAIACGEGHVVGLKADGTVVASGRYFDKYDAVDSVSSWHNIIAILASDDSTVGLKSDGTVVSAHYMWPDNVLVLSWKNIVAIAQENEIYGLKSDGMVISQHSKNLEKYSSWRDIVAIIGSEPRDITALKSNGTVVSTSEEIAEKVENWRDIIALGNNGNMGLKSDGTVVTTDSYDNEVSKWRNIVGLSKNAPLGVKADGTIVATEEYKKDFFPWGAADWRNIGAPSKEAMKAAIEREEQQREQAEIRRKEEAERQRIAEENRRIAEENRIKEEKRRHEEQVARWVQQGLCSHCGGQFIGMFTRKCSLCGRKK